MLTQREHPHRKTAPTFWRSRFVSSTKRWNGSVWRIETKAKRKRMNPSSEPKFVDHTISVTDPDSGFLNRPGKPSGMHYLSHQSLDATHSIIVDVAVTPANVSGII